MKFSRAFASRTQGIHLTTEGALFLLLCIGLGVAGWNTGNNLLLLIWSIGVSLFLLSALAPITLRNIEITRELPPRLQAEHSEVIQLQVINKKRFPPCGMIWISELHPTSIHPSDSGSPLTIQPIYLDWLDPAGVRHFKSTMHPAKRGRFQLRGFLIRTRFPFGLLEAWRIIPSPAELVVYPPWRQVNLKQWLINHQYPSGSYCPFFSSDPLDDGTWLRPYREGDELRRVHALRSASLASLVVREDARSTTPKRLCLRLSPSHNPSDSPPDAAALEEAIARLASAAQIAHDEGWIVDVLLPGIGCISIEANDSIDPLLTVLADFQPSADWSLLPPPQGVLVLEVTPSHNQGFE